VGADPTESFRHVSFLLRTLITDTYSLHSKFATFFWDSTTRDPVRAYATPTSSFFRPPFFPSLAHVEIDGLYLSCACHQPTRVGCLHILTLKPTLLLRIAMSIRALKIQRQTTLAAISKLAITPNPDARLIVSTRVPPRAALFSTSYSRISQPASLRFLLCWNLVRHLCGCPTWPIDWRKAPNANRIPLNPWRQTYRFDTCPSRAHISLTPIVSTLFLRTFLGQHNATLFTCLYATYSVPK
jgi:hypothetical protein